MTLITRWWWLPIAAVLAAASSGCQSGDADGEAAVVVADSASIRVVNVNLERADLPVWSVEERPTLSIGSLDNPSRALSAVVGAHRMADGRIVVGDRDSGTLRFFDGLGVPIAAVGGRGEGPGEFVRLWRVRGTATDSLYAYDLLLRRLSVLGPEGSLARSLALATGQESAGGVFHAALTDGTMLIQGFPASVVGDGRRSTLSPLYRFNAEGLLLDSLPALVENENFYLSMEGGYWFTPPPFASQTLVAAGRIIAVARTGDATLEILDPDGSLRSRVTATGLERAVTGRVREIHLEALRGNLGGNEIAEERFDRHLTEMGMPDVMPAWSSVAVDELGDIWLQDFDPGLAGVGWWTVFSSEGTPRSRVSLPGGLEPLHIGDDFVLGLRSDELDVPYVELHRLTR